MIQKLIISNARWLNPNGSFRKGSIHIRDGRILRLSQEAAPQSDDPVLDARGLLVLPGAIDPHVHFREPGQLYKEGIASGSKAALRGGVTTVVDMPNNKPACSTLRRLEHKKELFSRKSHINWGVMYHTTAHNRDSVENQITSAKIYMAKSSALPAITDPAQLLQLFRRFPRVSVHAEDETAFDTSPGRSPLHHENRPRRAITLALEKIENALLRLRPAERPRVVICHMNTADEVNWLQRMKTGGFDVRGETCPHYLFFTQDDYIREGAAFQVNPPIRTAADQSRLREGLAAGIIDFIGTDHAPHGRDEKSGTRPPSGIAGIEWLVPQMLQLVDEGVFGWDLYTKIMCAGAADCYEVKGRDGIREGNYADLVFVRRSEPFTQESFIQTKAAINLYERFNFKWHVDKVLVNGTLKYDGIKYYGTIKGKEV